MMTRNWKKPSLPTSHGCWDDYPGDCRSGNRGWCKPGVWDGVLGFRLACSVELDVDSPETTGLIDESDDSSAANAFRWEIRPQSRLEDSGTVLGLYGEYRGWWVITTVLARIGEPTCL